MALTILMLWMVCSIVVATVWGREVDRRDRSADRSAR